MNVEGDVVLVYFEEKPVFYARIELIQSDIKKNWYQVSLLLLTIPSQAVTWILREEYINGTPFTMGGNSVMLEKVDTTLPELHEEEESEDEKEKNSTGKTGKVIEFDFSRKDPEK